MKYTTNNQSLQNNIIIGAQVFIFTALECEAKPLVNFFSLKKESENQHFSIYKNEQIILTVTGIGKIAMAGALAYSSAIYLGQTFPIILNIGIAGHKTQAIGALNLVIKIIDADSGKHYYPQLIGNSWPETNQIITTSIPSTEYKSDCLHDMEASAFYEMALRFSTNELVHCIKVVSDNENSSIDQIKPKYVIEWIANHTNQIDYIIKHLVKLRESIAPIELEEYEDIIKKWHFTMSGSIRLQSLLKRWKILTNDNWQSTNKNIFNNSKEVLRQLEADINRLEFFL